MNEKVREEARKALRDQMDDASRRYWEIVDRAPWMWGPTRDPSRDDSELRAVGDEYHRLADEYEKLTGKKLWIRNCRWSLS